MARHYDPTTEMWRVEPMSRFARSGPTVLMFGGAAGSGIQFFELAASVYRGQATVMHFNLLIFGLVMVGVGAFWKKLVEASGIWCGRDAVQIRSLFGRQKQRWTWQELSPVTFEDRSVVCQDPRLTISMEQPGWGKFAQFAAESGAAAPTLVQEPRPAPENGFGEPRHILGICRPRFELLVALVPTILLFQGIERIFEPGRFEGFEDMGWLSVVAAYLVFLASESWTISDQKVERRMLFGMITKALAWSEVECASITRCCDGGICGVTLLTKYGSWSFNRTFSTQIDLVDDIHPRIPATVPIIDAGSRVESLPAT